jgi:hypothetical protein
VPSTPGLGPERVLAHMAIGSSPKMQTVPIFLRTLGPSPSPYPLLIAELE